MAAAVRSSGSSGSSKSSSSKPSSPAAAAAAAHLHEVVEGVCARHRPHHAKHRQVGKVRLVATQERPPLERRHPVVGRLWAGEGGVAGNG